MSDEPRTPICTNDVELDAKLFATHRALFDTWLPLDKLDLPAGLRADISTIADSVCKAMFAGLCASPQVALLKGMTDCTLLPFYQEIKDSEHAAVVDFRTHGFGGMKPEYMQALFSWMFEGSGSPESARVAMTLREIYLSNIWDAPLALPLTEIGDSPVFVSNPGIWAKRNAPVIPPSWLAYDAKTNVISSTNGDIDYLVIGSGPGGAMTAHELHRAGKKVVLIEKGNYIVWGSMDTMSCADLMFARNQFSTSDNGIVIRSGEAVGGGSTVNIDLAFSPLESTILTRIQSWANQGWIDPATYTPERLSAAYQYVRTALETREVEEAELNQDNLVLWRGSRAFGITPSLYHLNRFSTGESPSPVTQKRDAARQLLLGPIQEASNPLSLIPNADVEEVLFEEEGEDFRAIGVRFATTPPWIDHGNALVDPCGLNIATGTSVTIHAKNVIVAAGTIGSTRLLLRTARKVPQVNNPRIGTGLILHPSVPLMGVFGDQINLLQGLDSATFVDTFGVSPGFIFETMSGLPAYGALLIPGNGKRVYEVLTKFNQCAGFGVMLVDTPSESNRIRLDESGNVVIDYTLSAEDKKRFRIGVALAARIMFLAGAKEVIVPTNENWKQASDFNPMMPPVMTKIEEADDLEKYLDFTPNRTLLTSAHLQATNKMGPNAENSVVSTDQKVWNMITKKEVPNLYVMDGSIFPTSVGANPMQSIYTFARIFAEKLNGPSGKSIPVPYQIRADDRSRRLTFTPDRL
jgi:hypothetical protein